MNILSMGTATSYIKNLELNLKWQERKQNPLKAKEEDPQIASFKKQAAEQRRSQSIANIQGKMLSGLHLTQQELQYLRENSPADYQKAVQIEKERQEYKRELEQCQSKEDVEKLNQQKLQQFCTEAKTVAGNPNIPAAKKKELLEFIRMRMSAFMDEHASFIKTPEYQQLPEKKDEDQPEGEASLNNISSQVTNPPYHFKYQESPENLKDLLPPSFLQSDNAAAELASVEAAATAGNIPPADQSAGAYDAAGRKKAGFAADDTGGKSAKVSVKA